MSAVLGIVAIGVIIAWFWTHRHSHSSVETQARKGSGRRFGFGRSSDTRPLERVDDPRVLATILMQQLVRTGAPVTGAEKAQILALVADPIGAPDPAANYAAAWAYTEQDRSFTAIADDLLPTLRKVLDEPAQRQLIGMLDKVANAYGEESELQREAIDRLQRKLAAAPIAADRH